MSALMWSCAVPAAYQADASRPSIVRHGKAAPPWPISRARPRGVEHAAAELKHLLGPPRRRVGEERHDVDLGVPEVVALVAAAGHALRGHAQTLRARGRLHQREEVEAHRSLELRVALELDVAAPPEAFHLGAVRRL